MQKKVKKNINGTQQIAYLTYQNFKKIDNVTRDNILE